MKTKPIILPLLILSLPCLLLSQSIIEKYNHLGEIFIPELKSAPFPHPARANGHVYQEKTYSCQEHYSDSSVAIFIPGALQKTSKTNIVVYFHGWNNNIAKACNKFHLIEQFSASDINAIFIFPEGPKNSPDSHGGKMEDKNGLKNLIDEVLLYLTKKGKLESTNVGDIILAGHSGAYRAISFCLMHGGLTNNITDVILFDALYGNTEKYVQWIRNYNGRFINIYTDNGGTKEETENLMKDFDSQGIAYFKTVEKDLKQTDLTENRLIFIHTDLTHSEVISVRNQLQKYLLTSSVGTNKSKSTKSQRVKEKI